MKYVSALIAVFCLFLLLPLSCQKNPESKINSMPEWQKVRSLGATKLRERLRPLYELIAPSPHLGSEVRADIFKKIPQAVPASVVHHFAQTNSEDFQITALALFYKVYWDLQWRFGNQFTKGDAMTRGKKWLLDFALFFLESRSAEKDKKFYNASQDIYPGLFYLCLYGLFKDLNENAFLIELAIENMDHFMQHKSTLDLDPYLNQVRSFFLDNKIKIDSNFAIRLNKKLLNYAYFEIQKGPKSALSREFRIKKFVERYKSLDAVALPALDSGKVLSDYLPRIHLSGPRPEINPGEIKELQAIKDLLRVIRKDKGNPQQAVFKKLVRDSIFYSVSLPEKSFALLRDTIHNDPVVYVYHKGTLDLGSGSRHLARIDLPFIQGENFTADTAGPGSLRAWHYLRYDFLSQSFYSENYILNRTLYFLHENYIVLTDELIGPGKILKNNFPGTTPLWIHKSLKRKASQKKRRPKCLAYNEVNYVYFFPSDTSGYNFKESRQMQEGKPPAKLNRPSEFFGNQNAYFDRLDFYSTKKRNFRTLVLMAGSDGHFPSEPVCFEGDFKCERKKPGMGFYIELPEETHAILHVFNRVRTSQIWQIKTRAEFSRIRVNQKGKIGGIDLINGKFFMVRDETILNLENLEEVYMY